MIRLAQKPFLSVQGEGPRTGKLTVFVRFFGCNLRCPGFFQDNPTDSSTYIKPVEFDPKSYKTLAEFPVPKYGCDTLYAIDPKYKHLAVTYETVEALMADIEALLPVSNVWGSPVWFHPKTFNPIDICFTGGEPMLQQDNIRDILNFMRTREDRKYISTPDYVQFETNGTKDLSETLKQELYGWSTLFNVSPKLFNVTGEDGLYPEVLLNLAKFEMALKFVVNDTQAAFDELNEKVNECPRDVPIYVMPVGATYDQQNEYDRLNRIATMAVDNGFHISGRLHCNLFGNSHDR